MITRKWRRQWHPTSSTLAWKIPWTEEPNGLQSMGSWRVGHNWATSHSLFTFMHWRRKWQSTPVLNLLCNVFPFANVCACAQSCLTVCDPMDCSPPGSLCPWNSPSKSTGVSCHFLLQRIFPIQGSNLFPPSPALAGGFFTTVPAGKPSFPNR